MLQRLKQWAREIKLDVVAIGIAARDPRVPWYVMLLAAAMRVERKASRQPAAQNA